MADLLQTVAIVLTAFAMAPALAHALEFPGKKRLERNQYLAVQTIYYPGFTLLGFAEPGASIAVLLLLLGLPAGSTAFWQTLTALLALVGMQVVYWTRVHPANKYWLERARVSLGSLGTRFFEAAGGGPPVGAPSVDENDWGRLRDRWEHGHLARAGLAVGSFLLLVLVAVGT